MKNLVTKEHIIALGIVLVICLFTYSVVSMYAETANKQMKKLENINVAAKKSADIYQKKSDSAVMRSGELTKQISVLTGSVDENTKSVVRLQGDYNKKLSNLINTKNEKIYVPNGVPTDEQSAYLSDYQYKPY